MTIVTLDDKGRLRVPKALRDKLGVKKGDSFVVRHEGGVLQFAKATDPFDALAEEALEEHRQGKTRPLAEFAREQGIEL